MAKEKNSGISKCSPVAFKESESLASRIRRLVQSERLRDYALAHGVETFEEANDFDVEDDIAPQDPSTPYDMSFDPELGREITLEESYVLQEERNLAAKQIARLEAKKRAMLKSKRLKAKKKVASAEGVEA